MNATSRDIFEETLARITGELRALVHVPDDAIDASLAIFHFKSLGKGHDLIRAGQIADKIYYVARGALRTFFEQDGFEKTYNFHFENDWYSPYYSFLTQKPSPVSAQTLEQTDLIYLKRADLLSMYERFPCWQTIGRLMVEKSFIEKEEKEERFRFLSPEAHYQYLLKNRPDFVQRPPLYQLASFLGITPETLSRIRARLR